VRKDLDQITLERYSKMYDVKRKEGETNQELIRRITIEAEKIEQNIKMNNIHKNQ